MVLAIFFAWRVFGFLISYFTPHFIPYLGFFPYKEILVDYKLPAWISSFANFDGIHYMLIAQQGYSQYEQAFFPLFPFLIHVVNYFVHNFLISGLLVSNISFVVGLFYLQKLWRLWFPKQKRLFVWMLLFLLSFPSAFFFGALYTEGLFFMLIILSLYCLEKKNYYLAGLFAALCSGTRLIGAFLIIPFFLHFLTGNKLPFKRFTLHVTRYTLLILSPLLGLFSYMLYLWKTMGDPLYFLSAQPAFGANRSSHLIFLPQVYYRYFKILFTAAHDFQWVMSLCEVGIFSGVLIVILTDLWHFYKKHEYGVLFGLNLFSLTNLVLPTLTGTFSSIGRYALFSVSFFIVLAHITSIPLKIFLIALMIVGQIVLLGLFIQGYFVG